MKKTGALILLIIFLLSVSAIAASAEEVVIYEFWGKGCPHCTKLNKWLEEEIKPKYPDLIVKQHEVYNNNTNRQLYSQMSQAYGKKAGGVPALFIGEKRIVGFSLQMADDVEAEIIKCFEQGCLSPMNILKGEVKEEEPESKLTEQMTLGAVISGAIVDAINPCAFAVLILLLTTVLAAKRRKRALFAGLAFSLAIFISYFLMGLGLYSAIQTTGLSQAFFVFVAILAIVVGLFNLKDFFAYGKWFVIEIPKSWRPKLRCMIKGVTSVPGAFLVGFVVSLFLLPCTSGPYLVILGLLAKATTRNYALALLVLYNLIFILPILLITFAVYLGYTTTKKAQEWQERKLEILHLIAGLILIALGIGMFVAMKLGYL